MKRTITVSSKILSRGFKTSVDTKEYKTQYSQRVWDAVPKEQRALLGQTVAQFFTRFLPLAGNHQVSYNFPPPLARLFVDYGLPYSLSESPFEISEKKLQIHDVMRDAYNSEFAVSYHGIPQPVSHRVPFQPEKKNFVMPMSFGKDSLTTFSITRELGLTAHPIFFQEPACPTQNAIKQKLFTSFKESHSNNCQIFDNELGQLRQKSGLMWGWDMLLTQYTVLLLPFIYETKSNYLFWSNERSLNNNIINPEGYIVNATHEQTSQWILHLNNLLRSFSVNTNVASLLEPVYELLILSTLHNRYPKTGSYQLSCDGELKRETRWCGHCNECARVYIFLKAIGIDPKSVGLMHNMLTADNADYFELFGPEDGKNALSTLAQSYDERVFAFYLAYKQGVTGPCMDLFVKKLLPYARKNIQTYKKTFLTVHPNETIPHELQKPVYKIFSEELKKLERRLP